MNYNYGRPNTAEKTETSLLRIHQLLFPNFDLIQNQHAEVDVALLNDILVKLYVESFQNEIKKCKKGACELSSNMIISAAR
jgi:hypothetical protein